MSKKKKRVRGYEPKRYMGSFGMSCKSPIVEDEPDRDKKPRAADISVGDLIRGYMTFHRVGYDKISELTGLSAGTIRNVVMKKTTLSPIMEASVRFKLGTAPADQDAQDAADSASCAPSDEPEEETPDDGFYDEESDEALYNTHDDIDSFMGPNCEPDPEEEDCGPITDFSQMLMSSDRISDRAEEENSMNEEQLESEFLLREKENISNEEAAARYIGTQEAADCFVETPSVIRQACVKTRTDRPDPGPRCCIEQDDDEDIDDRLIEEAMADLDTANGMQQKAEFTVRPAATWSPQRRHLEALLDLCTDQGLACAYEAIWLVLQDAGNRLQPW